jgi:predicted nucleotidyltransferase
MPFPQPMQIRRISTGFACHRSSFIMVRWRRGVSSMPESVYSIEEIQAKVSMIARNYGVKRVLLFGSYARGEATETSDIDLLIDRGTLFGLELAGLYVDLEEGFQRHIDLLTIDQLSDKFLMGIEKEEILLYARQ